MPEKEPLDWIRTGRCTFCKEWILTGDYYREVVSWVHGPKLDGPVLREQTGRVAHTECIRKTQAGIAPETEALF